MNKVSEVMGWIMIICENTPEYKKAWRLIQAIDVAEAALMNLERGETS